MNTIDTKELEKIVSLYLDGELEQAEAAKFEEYMTTHPAIAREVEILRTAKRTLNTKPKLSPNDWFWLKLSNTIESGRIRSPYRSIIPRSAYRLSAAFLLTVALIGAIYFKDAPLFHKFFLEKKNQVQNTLMSGNILPFFSNLNKDDVLNFALFGSIALDSSSNTALQVKNTPDKGSQIEIVRRDPAQPADPITVQDFCQNVGIVKEQQQLIVDSILGTYKQRLQGSILVSENNEIAFHEQLADLNRVVVSTLAASLEPVQRVRFQKFLEERHAPFAVVSVDAPKVEPHVILGKIPQYASNNRYVVISKDTVGITEVKTNVDSIREFVHRHAVLAQREMQLKMLHEISALQNQFENNVVVAGSQSNRVRIHSTDRAFRINLESQAPVASGMEMVEMVKPRVSVTRPARRGRSGVTVIGDSAFSFELFGDDEVVRVLKRLPKGEFRYEIVDSALTSPRMKIMFKSTPGKQEFEAKMREMQLRERELIDLDSLLRESEREELRPQKKKVRVMEL